MPTAAAAARKPKGNISHMLAPAAAMSVVLLMIVPLPPELLDLLLSVDIGLAVTLMLTAIYVKQPVEFSVFPSLLLLLTLIRLSLNVDRRFLSPDLSQKQKTPRLGRFLFRPRCGVMQQSTPRSESLNPRQHPA